MNILKIANFFVSVVTMLITTNSLADSELRVRLGFRMPLDPLSTKTMADYDLSLIMSRTLFDYDDARNAKSGIVKTWNFDSKLGVYTFEVDNEAKWSDGSPISSEHIIFNLKRPYLLDSTFGKTLAEIIDINSIKSINNKKFSLSTIDKKPQKSLFQRLGSVFFSLVHPDDTKGNQVVSNKISCGPYVLKKSTDEELLFERNLHFRTDNLKSPVKIVIKKTNGNFSLDEFVQKKTWENLIQTSTLMPAEKANLLINSNLPTWTRGHDRVALIKPISGENLTQNREIIKFINDKKSQLKKQKLPLNVQVAESLQPFGYPLHDKLKNFEPIDLARLKQTSLRIVTNKTISTEILQASITELLSELKIKIIWHILETKDFISEMNNSQKFDLALFSFGVADPESATWMSLVFKNKFIEIDPVDETEFNTIIRNSNNAKEISQFKDLLKKMYQRGSYAPLYHFSTLSIGLDNLNFTEIKTLDETVDYSKIIFKK